MLGDENADQRIFLPRHGDFNPNLVGKTLAFTCRLDGDRWYHSVIVEVDGESYHIKEIWRRVK